MPAVGKVESEQLCQVAPSSVPVQSTPTTIYLGLDPGASGGIVFIGPDKTVSAYSMPATDADLWVILGQWTPPRIVELFAVLERNTGYVGDGGNPGSTMFKFGTNYGTLRMALTAAGIPFEEVTPQTWQKALGISPRKTRAGETKTQFKNRLKTKAQQLFPGLKITLATADALLIAEFCRRKRAGGL